MGTIITRKQGNNTYYLYQETYREKIKGQGKGKFTPVQFILGLLKSSAYRIKKHLP
ncbi:MAG: hypothetical protein LWW97_05000 [Deltaproteobacteria bacterium]|nr:hypothetical protein [Deltaproteobacteria bacterium]